MGFMDEVSAFTKGMGQKAKGNYDIVTLNGRISTLQKEINGIYLQIGKQYYVTYGDNPNESLKELVNSIRNLEMQISDIQQQIEKIRTATEAVQLKASPIGKPMPVDGSNGFCVKCGAPLPADSMFCVKCGTKVDKPNDVQSQTEETGN